MDCRPRSGGGHGPLGVRAPLPEAGTSTEQALKRHKAHRLLMRKRCRLGTREEAACRRHELRA
eukprot:12961027-Alexandrium_andersonii.AAC.1